MESFFWTLRTPQSVIDFIKKETWVVLEHVFAAREKKNLPAVDPTNVLKRTSLKD